MIFLFLQDIKKGVPIAITLIREIEILAEFAGCIDHRNFYIISKNIAENIDEFNNTQIDIKYNDGNILYTFTGEIVGTSSNPDLWDNVKITATSLLKEVPRRLDFRVKMNADVKINEFVGNRATMFIGEYVADGVSSDISKSGIRILSDYELDISGKTMYTLEIDLPYGNVYNIPSVLIHNTPTSVSITKTHDFEYGFAFDFTHLAGQQERLLTDILEAKIKTSQD